MMPSEIIGQVVVNKSSQADFEEGGIGATIDVHTRNPLDLDPMTLELLGRSAAYTDLFGRVRSAGSRACSAGRTPTRHFGFLIAAVYQERNIRRDGVEVLGYQSFDTDPGPATTNVLVPSLIGSALFQQERVREGGNFAVQFRPERLARRQHHGPVLEVRRRQQQRELPRVGLERPRRRRHADQRHDAGRGHRGRRHGHLGQWRHDRPRRRVRHHHPLRRSRRPATSTSTSTFRPNDDWTLHFEVGYTEAEGNTDKQLLAEYGPVRIVHLRPARPLAAGHRSRSIRPIRPRWPSISATSTRS